MGSSHRNGKVAAAALDRRPEARSYLVEELVQRVLDGYVRTPQFQRSIRWEAQDAADLFDSIYRGYPVGTLLFWKRAGEAGRIEYGTVVVDAPETTEALWVVDGQQRIHSLVRGLAGQPDDAFALLFDVEKEEFWPAAKVRSVSTRTASSTCWRTWARTSRGT